MKEMVYEFGRLVLIAQERPVVTRFFLFTPCCFATLRMFIAGLPFGALSFGRVSPESENAKRVAAVTAYFRSASASVEVRRVSLCLRLTIYATSLTAKKGIDEKPTLVALGKGKVQERTSRLFAHIARLIPNDLELPPVETLLALLQTQAHLVIRFDQYRRFPTRLWELTRKHNPCTFAAACWDFLHAKEADLDLGFSLCLQREAWEGRSDAEACWASV